MARRLPYSGYFAALSGLPHREIHNVVFDQLVTPRHAHYLREGEVRSWLDRPGLIDTQLSSHRGYSWRANATVAK